MHLCPAQIPLSSPSTKEDALTTLLAFIEELKSAEEPYGDVDDLEHVLRDLTMAVEAQVVKSGLAKLDVDAPAVLIDGVVHRRVMRSETTYHTASRDVKLTRTLYRTAAGKTCVAPLELKAGIVEGRWTPNAARQAVWAVSHLTPRDAATLFQMVGSMPYSKSSLDRLPKAVSAQWEAQRETFEAAIRGAATVPEGAAIVAISLDGVMAPMKDGGRVEKRRKAVRDGKQPSGPTGYRELACATLSFYDTAGGRLETWRYGRMPQAGKADLKAWLAAETGHVLTDHPGLSLVKVSDGARDNWTFLDGDHVPDGESVIDFFHAVEHLSRALATVHGEAAAQFRARFKTLRRRLRDDEEGVSKVIRALRHLRDRYPRRKLVGRELAYFRRDRSRMRYHELRARHLPIGSGVVEAACKTLVAERMKRSGMRWRQPGGQAILTFRALAQSGRFERGWQLLLATYTAVVQPATEPARLAA